MQHPDNDTDANLPEPANLRFLRRLVTVLTVTMIAGVLLIIGLIVIRFYDVPPALPDTLSLPDGTGAVSFTQGPDWYAVVTDRDQVLIFDRVTGRLVQTVDIE
ncbi:MAG: DUF6476 family protein [Pseudomonadota bacterium]